MAIAADRAGIQFRTLNSSKGPAVRATRAQADRTLYRRAIRALLEAQPGLTLREAEVADLVVGNGRAAGVVTMDGTAIRRAQRGADRRHLPRRAASTSASRAAKAGASAMRPRTRWRRGCASCHSRSGVSRPARRRASTAARSTTPPCGRSRATSRAPVFSFLGRREDHPAQVQCHITATNAAHARDHPRRDRPLADVHRPHRGHRPALLPLGRGQGRAFRRQVVAPGLSSSRKGSTRTSSTRTAFRPACPPTCSSSSCAASPDSSARR